MHDPTPRRTRAGRPVRARRVPVPVPVLLPLLALVLVASGCAKDDDGAAAPPTTSPPVSGQIHSTPVVDVGDGVHVVEVSLSEFAIHGVLVVPAGPVVLAVLNAGSADHDLSVDLGVDKPTTPLLGPGRSAVLDLGELAPGTYPMLCEVSGHAQAGMEATLVVLEADDPALDDPVAAAAAHGSGHGAHEDVDWAEMDRIMLESVRAFPAETVGRGNRPLVPTIADDGAKVFHLTTAITPWEVEPGRVVDAWTYDGQVPGPAIRVDVGDRVRVVVRNELPLGTDVHWHGISTPNEMDGVSPLTQDLILPGDEFTYEFTADEPRIGMYHAHHMGHQAIPNGMFGVFTIGEPQVPRGRTVGGLHVPDDLEVSQVIPMVLNDAGVIGYSLNGKSFPATQPHVVTAGDWIVVDYYNEGLQIHPMHLHQFPQLVFAKDGFPLDHPYLADTINVAPGERYSVLVRPDEPGVWVWHCHILNHVERDDGMFGMVTALIVQEADPT